MLKFIFPAVLCLAFACPLIGQAQDCGCAQPDPCCQKTRKKLVLVETQKEVCRLQRVCETDCCGCPQSKLKRVKKCVTRKKLALVDVAVDPCKKGLLQRVCDKIKSLGHCGCGCNSCEPACGCAPAPACGCDTGCGCGDAVPVDAVPAEETVAEPVETVMTTPCSSCGS